MHVVDNPFEEVSFSLQNSMANSVFSSFIMLVLIIGMLGPDWW